MNLSRRSFLGGLVAAPLVVPAARLMGLRGAVMPFRRWAGFNWIVHPTESAFQVAYRKECIAGFEQGMCHLRSSITEEAVIDGNRAYFLVANKNGLILA